MTILILGFAPFLVIVGAARAMFYKRHLTKNKGAFAQAGKVREREKRMGMSREVEHTVLSLGLFLFGLIVGCRFAGKRTNSDCS